jgi:predicted DNA-binding transcriptional regulator AlpA
MQKEKMSIIKRGLIRGRSARQISSCVSVSEQTIYKIIKKNNWRYLREKNKNQKRKTIIKMTLNGSSDEEIKDSVGVSKSTIYRAKKEQLRENKLTSWSEIKFQEIGAISKKYHKIFSLSGLNIDEYDIQDVLIDLLIHTDQKDIENKDAYFRKYAKKKIGNLKSRVIKYQAKYLTKCLTNENGEEIYSHSLDPEKILLLKEKLSLLGKDLNDYL